MKALSIATALARSSEPRLTQQTSMAANVWALSSGKNSLTVHAVIDDDAEEQAVLRRVTDLLAGRFSIRNVTVQVEVVACAMGESRGGAHFASDGHGRGHEH